MNIGTKEVVSIELTHREMSTVNESIEILDNIFNAFNHNLTNECGVSLVSMHNGEMIEIDELKRVMGVLDGLTRTTNWEIEREY